MLLQMALWARVQQLRDDAMRQIQLVYGVHFPIEVRHFFANWIEDQHWYTRLFSCSYYLCQGRCVLPGFCLFICLFVCLSAVIGITQKVNDKFC